MTTTKISERREVLTYDGDQPGTAYVGMWVDGIQIAAAIRQDEHYARRNDGARWSLWSSGLTLAPLAGTDASQRAPHASHPLPVRTEADARAWLNLLADLAEAGPTAVDRYSSHPAPGGGTKADTTRRADINALVASVLDEVDAANPDAGYRDYWVALHEQTDDIYW